MCYDPYLFHLPLSPALLISLHPHLLISPLFSTSQVFRRKGRGRQRDTVFWHQLLRVFFPPLSEWLFILKCSRAATLICLGNPAQPTRFSTLIIKIHEPASMSTLTDVSHISAFTSASFFIQILTRIVLSHSAIYSPVQSVLYLYFCTVLSGHLRAVVCSMLQSDGDEGSINKDCVSRMA